MTIKVGTMVKILNKTYPNYPAPKYDIGKTLKIEACYDNGVDDRDKTKCFVINRNYYREEDLLESTPNEAMFERWKNENS
jgi:hypothetical protein